MTHLPSTFFCLAILFRLVLGLSPAYKSCQLQKSGGEPALSGCPDGTLYVSATAAEANFSNVRNAIDSLPETGKAVILIGAGTYNERVNVARSAPLILLGQVDPAYQGTGNASQRNLVHISNNRHSGNGFSDEDTATFTAYPSQDHSFGNSDLRIYNINFENLAADYAVAPALSLTVTLSNVSFYGCTFKSWQDTFYVGYEANVYAVASEVYGQTDFVFGCGRCWIQSSIIANRGCGGGITAWDGTRGATNGIYISDSRIIRSPDASANTVTDGSCYLGRAWNDLAVAVFLQNYMDNSINPAGFRPWKDGGSVPSTTFFAEYDSYGPGGDTSARIPQDHILNDKEAAQYNLQYVFGEQPSWIDYEYQN